MTNTTPKKWILPAIVVSQFFCTSLWFAGNAILPDLISTFNLSSGSLANLTSAVQFGFITGTFLFAWLTIADRYSPSRVFFCCAIIAAVFNVAITIPRITANNLFLFRFLTGLFLAGIYPVGMKIAADYFQQGLGKSLGFLVGALVLGTAFPHLLKSLTADLPWKYVIFSISILSVVGGSIILLLVPDGPFRKAGQQLKLNTFLSAFRIPAFRSSAFGYFGHMWELYTFWAFVPVMLTTHNLYNHHSLNVPLLSFVIIAGGAIACALSGMLSQKLGAKRIATICLLSSGLCCLASPFFLLQSSPVMLTAFLIFWGWVVIADSPMFSTLVAGSVPQESRGTSLTIVNCIGFAITIVSIQLTRWLAEQMDVRYVYLVLTIGPVFGLVALLRKYKLSM